MLQFQYRYFIAAVVLFFTELLIALFIHDAIIRPYIGDVLVVILIYCFVKAFFKVPVFITAVSVLLLAYTVEMLQYFNIVEKLGLENSKLASVVIGTSFSWNDILAYTIGILLILLVEKILLLTHRR
jgi:hypothetical protein